MNYQLKELNKDQVVIGVSDFETIEELKAWKEKLIEVNPEHTFEELDLSEANAAIKAKEAKKKAAKEALKNLDIEGATTVAKLKAIVKALIEANE